MRDYAKLSPFFWTRGSGKRLRGDAIAQVVAAYVSTCPSANLIGLYYLPVATLAHETGLSPKQAREALTRLEAAGYAFYDDDAELVWVPNVAKFEIGPDMKSGDKRRGKVLAELDQVGHHRFAADFYRTYGGAYGLGACPFDAPSMGHQVDNSILGPIRSGSDPSPDPSPGGPSDREAREPVTEVRSRKKPETPAPPVDATPEAVSEWAGKWSVPPDHPEFRRFLLHAQQNDRRCRDWKAAWRRWLENAPLFAPKSRAGPNGLVQPADNRAWKLPEVP